MLTHKDNLTILKSRIIIKAKGQEQQSLFFLAFNERLSRAEIILSDPDDHSHLKHFLSRHKFGDEVLFCILELLVLLLFLLIPQVFYQQYPSNENSHLYLEMVVLIIGYLT